MGLKFSISYQIPFYETDITHQVKLPHLLAFSLQVSGMQSESLGNTDKDVFDKYGLVWIVTDYAIEIDRLPRYNEKVTINEPKNPAGLPKQRCHPVYPAWRKDPVSF